MALKQGSSKSEHIHVSAIIWTLKLWNLLFSPIYKQLPNKSLAQGKKRKKIYIAFLVYSFHCHECPYLSG